MTTTTRRGFLAMLAALPFLKMFTGSQAGAEASKATEPPHHPYGIIWWAEREVTDFTDAGRIDIADWDHWHEGAYWESDRYDASMPSMEKVYTGVSYAPKVIVTDEATIHAFDQMLRDLAVTPSREPSQALGEGVLYP